MCQHQAEASTLALAGDELSIQNSSVRLKDAANAPVSCSFLSRHSQIHLWLHLVVWSHGVVVPSEVLVPGTLLLLLLLMETEGGGSVFGGERPESVEGLLH